MAVPSQMAVLLVDGLLGAVEKWTRKPIQFGGPIVSRSSGETKDPMAVLYERADMMLQAQHERTREQAAQLAEQDSMLDWAGGSTGNAKGTARRIAASLRTLPWETP